jgi:hypothetical protein
MLSGAMSYLINGKVDVKKLTSKKIPDVIINLCHIDYEASFSQCKL